MQIVHCPQRIARFALVAEQEIQQIIEEVLPIKAK